MDTFPYIGDGGDKCSNDGHAILASWAVVVIDRSWAGELMGGGYFRGLVVIDRMGPQLIAAERVAAGAAELSAEAFAAVFALSETSDAPSRVMYDSEVAVAISQAQSHSTRHHFGCLPACCPAEAMRFVAARQSSPR